MEALTIPAEIRERFLTIPAVHKPCRGGRMRETLTKRSGFDDVFTRQCIHDIVFLEMARRSDHD